MEIIWILTDSFALILFLVILLKSLPVVLKLEKSKVVQAEVKWVDEPPKYGRKDPQYIITAECEWNERVETVKVRNWGHPVPKIGEQITILIVNNDLRRAQLYDSGRWIFSVIALIAASVSMVTFGQHLWSLLHPVKGLQ